LPAATRRGVIVMNTPGGNTAAAAELTMAHILGLSRNIPQSCLAMKVRSTRVVLSPVPSSFAKRSRVCARACIPARVRVYPNDPGCVGVSAASCRVTAAPFSPDFPPCATRAGASLCASGWRVGPQEVQGRGAVGQGARYRRPGQHRQGGRQVLPAIRHAHDRV
jgi:hypothetical protein